MDNTITFRKETPEISHEELLQDLKKQEMEAVAKRDYYEAQKIKNKMDNIEAKLEMKTKNPSKGIPSMASEKAFKALLEKEKQQDHKEKQEKTGNLMEQLNEPDDNQLPDMSEIQRNKRAFYEKI
jgi:hypothetical protein